LQSFVIKVENPNASPQSIAIYENPRGGRSTGTYLIDGVLVNGFGWRLWQGVFARIGSWLQSGQVGSYAWWLVLGVLAIFAGLVAFRRRGES